MGTGSPIMMVGIYPKEFLKWHIADKFIELKEGFVY
jgi:hypothetical protein